MRRASVWVHLNIAEAAGRKSITEFCGFLYKAMGFLSDLDTLLEISQLAICLQELNQKKFIQKIIYIRITLSKLI